MAKRKPPQQPQRKSIAVAVLRSAREEAVRQILARDRRATIGELLSALASAKVRPGDPVRRSLALERSEIDRGPIAAAGEDFDAAFRRILLERGASTRQVAALTTSKVNNSNALQTAKRAKRRRKAELVAEITDIDRELAWWRESSPGVGKVGPHPDRLQAQRARAQAALDRLMHD